MGNLIIPPRAEASTAERNWRELVSRRRVPFADAAREVEIYDDFIDFVSWTENSTGVNTDSFIDGSLVSDGLGVGVLQCGDASVSNQTISRSYGDAGLVLGTAAIDIITRVKIPTLPTVAQAFSFRFGLSSPYASLFNNGVWIRADSTSGNWFLHTASGGVGSNVDSGVAVTTDYTLLQLFIPYDISYVEARFDKRDKVTLATNIPTSTLGIFYTMHKTAGASTRYVYNDFVHMKALYKRTRY